MRKRQRTSQIIFQTLKMKFLRWMNNLVFFKIKKMKRKIQWMSKIKSETNWLRAKRWWISKSYKKIWKWVSALLKRRKFHFTRSWGKLSLGKTELLLCNAKNYLIRIQSIKNWAKNLKEQMRVWKLKKKSWNNMKLKNIMTLKFMKT